MRKSVIIVVLLLFAFSSAFSQKEQITLRGKVVDTAGAPLGGVSVKASSKAGTITNDKGEFLISYPPPARNNTLTVSYVGYITQTINITGSSDSLEIVLKLAAKTSLGDVVVIGAQEFSRRKLTAAVSSISGDVVENLPAASVDQLLQGRIAGLNVQIASGEPGVTPTIVVRGNSMVNTSIGNSPTVAQAQAMSSPLFVIDGVPIDPSQISNNYDVTGTDYLAGININDIASVDVEKDAAATAAWGSRGANGVIIIKTRKATSKTPAFDVNVYTGVNQIPKLVPTYTGAAERQAKMDLINAYNPYTLNYTGNGSPAPIPQILTDSLNPYFNNAVDWQGMFYRSAGDNNVDVTMSQATDGVNYRVSGNYYNEQGIIKQFGYQRYSIRGNFNFTISKNVNSQFIFSAVREDRQRGAKFNNSDNNTPFSGLGAQPSSFYLLSAFDSSEYLGIAGQLRNKNTDMNYTASWTTNFTVTPWLQYTLMGAATVTNSNRDYFSPSNSDSSISNLQGYGGGVIPSYAEADRNIYNNYYLRNSLNFHKTFNTSGNHHHNVGFLLGQEYNVTELNYSTVSGYNTPANSIQTVTGIPQSDLSGGSDYQKDALLSLTGQLQYDYDGKYLFYGGMRGDASSRFGADNKWGYFPSVSAGWIISDEKFMAKLKNVIDYLKIRASIGLSGSNAPYYYAPFNNYVIQGTYNGTQAVMPSYTNGLTKDNLQWSKINQRDLGIDAQLLHNRINISADIYNKVTSNDFWNFQLPFFTGFQSIYYNSPDLWVNNRGLDLTITSHNLSPKSKFQWNTNLVLSWNRNLIAKLPNGNQSFVASDYYGNNRLFAVGQPIYEFYQLKYQGIYNNISQIPFNPVTGQYYTYYKGNYPIIPGYPIWQNTTGGTDVWTNESTGNYYGSSQPTGDPNPRYTGGLNNDFSYKNFFLSVQCVYTLKRTVINTYEADQFANLVANGVSGFATTTFPAGVANANYWTPAKAQNPDYSASIPAINPYAGYIYQFNGLSSEFNVDGSYFKVKFVTFGYVVPKKVVERFKLKGVKIYGNMTNLLIIKNKNNTLPDPEAVDATGIYTGGLYPQSKTYTIGATLQF